MAYVVNASTIAYDFIKDRIDRQEWRPGDKIWTEARLCEHLGISRVAVRQAIDKLVALSLVHRKQGSGTYVSEKRDSGVMDMGLRDAGEEDILDILEFRRYFEYGNSIMFVQNATEEDIAALEKTYQNMQLAAACGDMKTFYTEDYLFHNIIAKGTKKNFVFRISTTLNSVLRENQANINRFIGPEIGLEYHAHIIECVKKRDSDLAAIYMQRHIDATIAEVKKIMEERPENGAAQWRTDDKEVG